MAVLGAAQAILSGAASRRAASQQLEGVTDRLAALESSDEAEARVLVELAEQVQTLSAASAAQVAQQRRVMVISFAGLALGLIALAVALLTRFL